MNEPTHQWCPKCNAMLPAYLERCPRCDTDLKNGGGQLFSDLFQIGATVFGVVMIPIVVIVAVAVLCLILTQ